jgi:hypothetical protein
MFTPFHKPPYPYPYGRSVDETTTVDLFKKELLDVRGPRSFGESNIDLGGDNL